jgi:predicted hotdog family 3-hydroxylacyl-ACP dehydratase
MRLDHEWIGNHIPHAGTMCLLDEVLDWDAQQIRCRSTSHRSLDNPLRAYGRLGAACGVEYAAQSMAVHGVLVAATGTNGPAVGYLASVRGVRLFVERLDDLSSDLIATATRVTSDNTTVLYDFAVFEQERALLQGRATIIFDIRGGSATHSAPL